MTAEKKPPESAKELLDRYAQGERDFAGALLMGADLEGANLRGANLRHANFQMAKLSGADFQGADLREANFQLAWFGGAIFRLADLRGAVLDEFNGFPSNLKDCRIALGNRWVGRWDVQKLLAWYHLGAVITDLETLTPQERALLTDTVPATEQHKGSSMLQSTFISYGAPDTAFAQRLNDALLHHGVTTFFFAKDAVPGQKLHRLMREGVNQHDRVILVCSKASLDRSGVLNEITETLQREARDGGKEYLIPITLDEYVFNGWSPGDPGIAQAIRDRVVADFRGTETDSIKFEERLRKLIAALRIVLP